MSKEHVHDELHRFVFDLNHHTILQPEDGQEEVWQRIIDDVRDYETRMSNPWYPEDAPPQGYSIEQSERPDIVYQNESFVMGIECFEYDASKKIKKGSKQKRAEQEADREIEKEYRQSETPPNGFLSIEKLVDVEFSITSYCESLLSNFTAHKKHIGEYRRNLMEKYPGKRGFLTFFIEDTTAIGNYVITNGKTEALDPLKLPPFLGVLASTQGLDYVIVKTTDSYVPSLRIQRIAPPLLEELSKNCYRPNDSFVQYQYKRQSHFLR